jgi:hypothetical protein
MADNSRLWIALGATAVAGGAYYYYTQSEDAKAVEAKAKKHEEELRNKAREAANAAKARTDDAYKKGQLKYEDAKVSIFLLLV